MSEHLQSQLEGLIRFLSNKFHVYPPNIDYTWMSGLKENASGLYIYRLRLIFLFQEGKNYETLIHEFAHYLNHLHGFTGHNETFDLFYERCMKFYGVV